MTKKIFTKEEIKELSKNKNVKKCSEKPITYSKNFKISAVKLYEEGLTAREIFENAGFSIEVIGRKKPNDCLRRWNKTFRVKGISNLRRENRGKTKGGRPIKIKDKSDKDKIERLEAENAYLKEEKKLLIKPRAKRNY